MELMPVANDMKPVQAPKVITGTFPAESMLQENELSIKANPSRLVMGTMRNDQSVPDMSPVLED